MKIEYKNFFGKRRVRHFATWQEGMEWLKWNYLILDLGHDVRLLDSFFTL